MPDTTVRPRVAAHRRRRRGVLLALAAAVVAAVVAAGAVTAARADVPAAQSHGRDSEVLHFGVRFSPFTVIDVPPRQRHRGDYQAGDYTVFSDRLTDRTGATVGTEGGSGMITRVSTAGAQVHFILTIQLRDGQIAAQGLSSTAPTKQLAVVGGTGSYTGARGHLVLVEKGDGTGTLTVTLGS